jgi:hypothetical protein
LIFPLRQNIGFALKTRYRGAQIINLNVRNAMAALLRQRWSAHEKEIKDLGWPFIATICKVMQADCDTFPHSQ